eukprot:433332_1
MAWKHCDWHCNECNDTNANFESSPLVVLRTWEEYAISTMKGNQLYDFFKNKNWNNINGFRDIYDNDCYCGHHYFNNQQLFMLSLWKYSINHPHYKQIFSNHKTSTCCFKDGICNQCSEKFIVFTNGLCDI